MLHKIFIHLSILALCFTAFSASAEWFEVHNIVPTFKKSIIDFAKEHWLLSLFAVLCVFGYLFNKNK